MSLARHAKPRPPKSGAPLAAFVVLLAVAVGAVALFSNDLDVLRWTLAGLAVLCVLLVVLIRTAGRRSAATLEVAIDQYRGESRAMQLELSLLVQAQREMVLEISHLREQVANYVAPVVTIPEVAYPSLHVPLVRAAFAEEHAPAVPVPMAEPLVPAESASIDVSGDAGSDPTPPRQLLDLTASEIARLRHAN